MGLHVVNMFGKLLKKLFKLTKNLINDMKIHLLLRDVDFSLVENHAKQEMAKKVTKGSAS